MDMNGFFNDLAKINYDFAKRHGIYQKPHYAVQKEDGVYNIVKNGEVIAVFIHPIRAYEFKQKLIEGE